MSKLVSIPFTYRNKECYMLIRFLDQEESTVLKVTIMDGELEMEMAGRNIFQYRDGRASAYGDESGPHELQMEILKALNDYFTDSPHKVSTFSHS